MEHWKDLSSIKGLDDFVDYQISSKGRLKSFKYSKDEGKILVTDFRKGNGKVYEVITLPAYDAMPSLIDRLQHIAQSDALLAVVDSRLPNHGEDLAEMSKACLAAFARERYGLANAIRSVGARHSVRRDAQVYVRSWSTL